jgi:hypothetical protein
MFRRYLRFWRADPRRDVDDELEFHLVMRAEEFQQNGMNRDDAERATRDRFGDVNVIHSEVERMAVRRYARQLRVQWIDALQQDLRLAVRSPCAPNLAMPSRSRSLSRSGSAPTSRSSPSSTACSCARFHSPSPRGSCACSTT